MVGGARQRSGMTGRRLGLHKKRGLEEGRRLLRRPLGGGGDEEDRELTREKEWRQEEGEPPRRRRRRRRDTQKGGLEKGPGTAFTKLKQTNYENKVSLLHIIWGRELLAQAMNFVAGDFHPERGGAAPGRMKVR